MWYGSNEALLGEYGDAVMPREHEWDSRWWSPIINAEHLAMRERAGIVDLSAFAIFDIVGPGAAQAVQKIVVAQADVGEGRVIYTPVLDAKGGFRSDLTVMRLAHDRYRVVTGGAHGMADLKWFADHLDGDAQIVDQTSAFTTIGLWGPKARDILGRLTDDDISHARLPVPVLPHRRARQRGGARLPDLLRRRAGLGALRADGAGRPAVGPAARGRASPTARCPSASACTAPPAASRRATARTASSSTASARSSRRACSGPRSRPPTSSAGTPTSRSGTRRRRRCCAR